jgi:glutamyl-tRNA synthetase
VRTRFAPSPTGDLHLGGAWTALASWVTARVVGGTVVLRVEDLDSPRIVRGSQGRIEEDLEWLGLGWDEGPYLQSERGGHYEAAIAELAAQELVYPCDCSRAEIARVASAPHPGEETVYPGICRGKDPARAMKRAPALRVRVPARVVAYDDVIAGLVGQNLGAEVGDFVLQRGDGVFAYQLAVVVDDVAMGITDVVRGADLVSSTPRQVWLAGLLGGAAPRYAHVPLVTAPDGARLEKRTPRSTVRELRQEGVTAETIVGAMAFAVGMTATPEPKEAAEVVAEARTRNIVWRKEPWAMPAAWDAR